MKVRSGALSAQMHNGGATPSVFPLDLVFFHVI